MALEVWVPRGERTGSDPGSRDGISRLSVLRGAHQLDDELQHLVGLVHPLLAGQALEKAPGLADLHDQLRPAAAFLRRVRHEPDEVAPLSEAVDRGSEPMTQAQAQEEGIEVDAGGGHGHPLDAQAGRDVGRGGVHRPRQ